MADYFPYFIEATYQFEGTCAVLVLPNGSDIRIDEEAHVSGIYQGDGSVLITYTYVVYTRGERESKKVSEQFVLRPGERIIKKYYEQSITRLSNIWTHETEISLVPLEENKDRYFRIYREEGENDSGYN